MILSLFLVFLSLSLAQSELFMGSHCVESFELWESSILRVEASLARGARVLSSNYSARTFKQCVLHCCTSEECTTATWDERSGDCFLFDCGDVDNTRCRFDAHSNFMTANLMVDRASFDLGLSRGQEKHVEELRRLESLANELQRECGPNEFACKDGGCIAVYDRCDSIPQCKDGSDEIGCNNDDKENDPTNDNFNKMINNGRNNVVRREPPKRPADINNWGREGELYRPDYNELANNPYNSQRQSLWPQQNYNPMPYGYYPHVPMPLNPAPGYFPPMYPASRSPPEPESSSRRKPKSFSVTKASTTKTSTTTAKTTTTTTTTTTVTTKKSQEEVHKVMLKDLRDEDFVMRTPFTAMLSLFIGLLLSLLLVLYMVCRCRSMRRVRRKRNLASDANNDYLVNGMYL